MGSVKVSVNFILKSVIFGARDAQGRKYQIKVRDNAYQNTSFNNLEVESFDYLLGGTYDVASKKLLKVYMIPVNVVKEIGLGFCNRLRFTSESREVMEKYVVFRDNPKQ